MVSNVLLGLAEPASLPEVATSALVDGCDTPSMRKLAGQSPVNTTDATEMFMDALSELHLSLPTPREAVLILAHRIANDISAGAIPPRRGAEQIWRISLRLPEQRFPQLDTFVYAASEWEDRPQARNVLIAGIVAAARELVVETEVMHAVRSD